MSKISVALTGGIGSGKSTVGKILQNLGAEVISGDELGRIVLASEQYVQDEIVRKLGADVRGTDGSFNRRLIAARVFANRDAAEWLKQITFPGIYSRWQAARSASQSMVIVFDAALIFEWGIEAEFDEVLVVRAPFEEIIAWSRGRFTEQDLMQRSASQLDAADKAARATCVIDNDGTLKDLELKVIEFWNKHIQPRIA